MCLLEPSVGYPSSIKSGNIWFRLWEMVLSERLSAATFRGHGNQHGSWGGGWDPLDLASNLPVCYPHVRVSVLLNRAPRGYLGADMATPAWPGSHQDGSGTRRCCQLRVVRF